MLGFITVTGADFKVLKIPILEDGVALKSVLRDGFLLKQDVPIALYKDGILLGRLSDDSEGMFRLGSDWKDAHEFKLKWKERRSSRPNSSAIPNPSSNQTVYTLSPEKLSCLNEWRYVCHEGGENGNCDVCVSVITQKYAVSAAHCFPNAKKGDAFNIINVSCDDEEHNYKKVEVRHVERLRSGGKGSDIIIFGSRSNEEMFATAPRIISPYMGVQYIVLGKDPYRPGDNVGLGTVRRIIASHFVDNSHHVRGDSGNNADYSGGLVLSAKGQHLLGLVTSPSSEYRRLEGGEWIEVAEEQSQPRSSILLSLYIELVIREIEEERREMEPERIQITKRENTRKQKTMRKRIIAPTRPS